MSTPWHELDRVELVDKAIDDLIVLMHAPPLRPQTGVERSAAELGPSGRSQLLCRSHS